VSSAQLERVDLDGRITFRFTSATERREILIDAGANPDGNPNNALVNAANGIRAATWALRPFFDVDVFAFVE